MGLDTLEDTRPGAATDEELDYLGGKGKTGAGRIPVPADKAARDRLRKSVRQYAAGKLVPPLTMPELEEHAGLVLRNGRTDGKYAAFVMVLLHNEVWRAVLAAVPFDRRILLLPPCLRSAAHCPAGFDEMGLLCERCGRCVIGDLAREAEALGYAVLVAEGTSTVATLIEHGRMQGLLGVSCMSALERAFPHTAATPFPSLAIPLVRDGCEETAVDAEWVREELNLRAPADAPALPSLDGTLAEVRTWFKREALQDEFDADNSETECIGLEWMSGSGKRWRPFLVAYVFRALQAEEQAELPAMVRKVAVGVECIHKASLVYDDIQDDDARRYDQPTVHQVHGVPIALNVGLDLLGHGYRLIAQSGASAEQRSDMLALAADGHCRLCVGQGAELSWVRDPKPLSAERVLDVFRMKTAPSFVVVFRLGAILGGADRRVHDILDKYSEALGVAYQIRDDLQDFRAGGDPDDIRAGRLSLTVAIAHQRARPMQRDLIVESWRHGADETDACRIRDLALELDADKEALRLLQEQRDLALEALKPLRNGRLKILLHHVIGRVIA